MKSSRTDRRCIMRNAMLALGLAAIIGGATAAPALADEYWHHQRRDTREQAWRDHERWDRDDWRYADRDREQRYAYTAPSYGYSYAPPAPAYVAPPSFNLVFPFTIR